MKVSFTSSYEEFFSKVKRSIGVAGEWGFVLSVLFTNNDLAIK